MDPGNSFYYYSRGKCLKELKKYKEGIEDFNKTIELDASNPEYYYRSGWCYEKLQSYENAIKDYSKAIELDPKGNI